MGIRALCAAAAVVAGVGQAEAATVDRVTMTLNAEYICEIGDCEDDPAPGVDFFLPTDVPVTGWLSIGDKDDQDMQEITFSYNGMESILGPFIDFSGTGYYQSVDAMEGFYAFNIDWNGLFGSLWYRDDDAPWSLDVRGTLELAPVPLPATAALLPMGLGALAMMRKRRRQGS